MILNTKFGRIRCRLTYKSDILGIKFVVWCYSAVWTFVFSIMCAHTTFDFVFIILWPVQVHGGCIPIQRIDGVGVGEQLREERLKDVGEVWWMWGEKLQSVQKTTKLQRNANNMHEHSSLVLVYASVFNLPGNATTRHISAAQLFRLACSRSLTPRSKK